MKLPLLLLALASFTAPLFAHDLPNRGPSHLGPLSEEEIQLVQNFRENPEPYRRVLYSQRPPHRPHGPVLGPRDIIDVTVSGGLIAFSGKRRGYHPFSFRIVRGETIEVGVRREGRFEETTIRVSYRPDGLHFDVPNQSSRNRAEPRGFIVLPEDERWNSSAPIPFEGVINDSRSISEAQAVVFNIRYASAHRR